MGTLRRIVFFYFIILLVGSCHRRKEYDLILVINKAGNLHAGSSVLLNGLKIGEVEAVDATNTGGQTMINLRISQDIEISRASVVKCRESLLGDAFIDISVGGGGAMGEGSYISGDTLYGGYAAPVKRMLDSNAQKKIFDKLDDLKSTIDSIANEEDSVDN